MTFSATLPRREFAASAPPDVNEWLSLLASTGGDRATVVGRPFPTMVSRVRPAGTLSRSPIVTLNGVTVIATSDAVTAHFGRSASPPTLSATAPCDLSVPLDAAGLSRGATSTSTVTCSHWGRSFAFIPPAKVAPPAATPLP